MAKQPSPWRRRQALASMPECETVWQQETEEPDEQALANMPECEQRWQQDAEEPDEQALASMPECEQRQQQDTEEPSLVDANHEEEEAAAEADFGEEDFEPCEADDYGGTLADVGKDCEIVHVADQELEEELPSEDSSSSEDSERAMRSKKMSLSGGSAVQRSLTTYQPRAAPSWRKPLEHVPEKRFPTPTRIPSEASAHSASSKPSSALSPRRAMKMLEGRTAVLDEQLKARKASARVPSELGQIDAGGVVATRDISQEVVDYDVAAGGQYGDGHALTFFEQEQPDQVEDLQDLPEISGQQLSSDLQQSSHEVAGGIREAAEQPTKKRKTNWVGQAKDKDSNSEEATDDSRRDCRRSKKANVRTRTVPYIRMRSLSLTRGLSRGYKDRHGAQVSMNWNKRARLTPNRTPTVSRNSRSWSRERDESPRRRHPKHVSRRDKQTKDERLAKEESQRSKQTNARSSTGKKAKKKDRYAKRKSWWDKNHNKNHRGNDNRWKAPAAMPKLRGFVRLTPPEDLSSSWSSQSWKDKSWNN